MSASHCVQAHSGSQPPSGAFLVYHMLSEALLALFKQYPALHDHFLKALVALQSFINPGTIGQLALDTVQPFLKLPKLTIM